MADRGSTPPPAGPAPAPDEPAAAVPHPPSGALPAAGSGAAGGGAPDGAPAGAAPARRSRAVRVIAGLLGLAAAAAAGFAAGRLSAPAAPADPAHPPAAAGARGLAAVEDGYQIIPVAATLPAGRPAPFRFRIVGPDGRVVTAYAALPGGELELTTVRRDLTGFRRVAATRAPDGTWTAAVIADGAGAHRVIAHFRPAGHARTVVVGHDTHVAGDHRPLPLPAPAGVAAADGYEVGLDGGLAAGGRSRLTFSVSRGGALVGDLTRRGGSNGLLTVYRVGDLATLPADAISTPTPGLQAFDVQVPAGVGAYRIFFDFVHGGRPHAASFTRTTGPPPTAP
ncbi:hypothetical protein GCM10010123_10130 [Pilimelia anulata]|uniref:Uncharacterized protein n=1 Tax=Pilimelia anulata TaxID=53371 RepID=A0A8J3F7V2_9ACTN|nr:hypothetical protein [Pilimelia anulata]GGJ82434.1 hypothetical protein GCM10010123_10130 [Pilimelia anulata]